MLILEAVWQYRLPCAEVRSLLSTFFRLLAPLVPDPPIGDVLKKTTKVVIYRVTDVFAAHPICFSKMEAVGKLSGESLSRGRHCGFKKNNGC